MDRDTAVRPQYIIHVQFMHTFGSFILECLCIRGIICIFVAEELVADFPGQQDADIRGFPDRPADQVHADGCPDRGDVIGRKRSDHRLQRIQHILFRHDDFCVVGPDPVGCLPGILEIDRIGIHAYRKRPDRFVGQFLTNGTYQAGIQTAGEQIPQRSVGVQPLPDTFHQAFPDAFCSGCDIIRKMILHV